jgi:SAM-dependent methyltransferase
VKSQIITGLRTSLSNPRIYDAFQNLMGAHRGRRYIVEHFVRAQPGARVLDIGCGTAEILDFLPAVEYVGFDISAQYIESARSRYGQSGQFFCQELTPDVLKSFPRFDIILAIGLLHHLDDFYAEALLRIAKSALKPAGRLISIDPVLEPGQNLLAYFIVKRDRGQHVRTAIAYRTLTENVFSYIHGVVRHRRWIPYTYWIMECVV